MSTMRYWKYTIYGLMIIYVSYISISIYHLDTYVNHLQEYSTLAGRETREIRTRLHEMQNILPGLLSAPGLKASDIEKELHRHDLSQNKTLEQLEHHFEGNPQFIANIRDNFAKLRAKRLETVTIFEHNTDFELASQYFRDHLEPIVSNIDENLNEVSQSISETFTEIQSSMHGRMNLIIGCSIFFGLLIIIMAIIADRRQQENAKEIEYREKLFQQLASNVDEVFIIAKDASNLEFVAPNSLKALNIPSETLLHDPARLYSILNDDDRRWLSDILQGKLRLDQPGEQNIRLDSMNRYLKLRIYPINVSNSSSQQKFIIVISDQTAMLLHQQALSDALENAHAASEAKSSFLSHMSHEIRTPMNAIIGMTTIALSRLNDPERIEDCLVKIAESSRHLLGLINDVLDMSKIESGKLSIANENFNLHHSIDNINNLVRPQTQARKQYFEILLEGVEDENLIGDPLRLNQILLNLLSNAYKFTPEEGQITLKIQQLTPHGKKARFRFIVSDTGIGMSQEFLERIYMPFEQATSSTTSKYGGTGLGMSITSNLISLMGGAISVKSSEGKGTCFTVELPFGLSDAANLQKHSLPLFKILIVDDDQGTCEHAKLLLSKMRMEPHWTLSGAEAINMAREAHEKGEGFDICLVDWKMPDMDGATTARKLREAVGDDMLIIMISAYDWGAIEEDARAAGVNDFIPKPFFASTLLDALLTATRHMGVLPHKDDSPAQPSSAHDFSGKRILLVEDNEFNREIGQEFLEMAHAEVEHAENGRVAVDMVTQSPAGYYDLVLMDVEMPLMNGYEATEAIRSSTHPQAQSLVILAMTANAFAEDVARATASGMNAHLAKPIDVNELYNMLAKYLSGKEKDARMATQSLQETQN